MSGGEAAFLTALGIGKEPDPGISLDVVGPMKLGGALTHAGNLLFTPDNTYNIGASGANRPANTYAGTSMNTGGAITSGIALQIAPSGALTGEFGQYIYGVGNSGAANAERAKLVWSGNIAYLLVDAIGTGAQRELRIGTGLTGSWSFNPTSAFNPQVDNSQDIGFATGRVRSGYFGTSINLGSNPVGAGLIRIPLGSTLFDLGTASGPFVTALAATLTQTSGNPSTLYWATNASPTAVSTAIFYGPLYADTLGKTANLSGATIQAINLNTGYNLASGSLGLAIGVNSTIFNGIAGGTINTGYSFSAASPTATGPITTVYGFYAAAQKVTGVTTGYGFYSAGTSDLNIFSGQVVIGADPGGSSALRMTGGIYQSGNFASGFGGAPQPNIICTFFSATPTNIPLVARAIGGQTGDLLELQNSASNTIFQFASTSSMVNGIQFFPSNTGNPVAINAGGADINITLLLDSKGTGRVQLLSAGADIQWGKPLVALGGGAAPTLGTIGGTGPATAVQNSWMRVVDATGAPFWVPVWK
jgi:hypothetical protein